LEEKLNKNSTNPTVNRKNPASSGSPTTPEVTALTLKEAGAAGSLFTVACFLMVFMRSLR
jgi:hypothetical protein